MHSIFQGLMVAGIFSLTAMSAAVAGEIVIAIRYLQADGPSHSHLYLYREDGKPLRQLTRDNSGQDSSPIFSRDGQTIVFTRERSNAVKEIWSIEPRGANLEKLDAAPDWYSSAKETPYFTNIEAEKQASQTAAAATPSPVESVSASPTPVRSYKAPDDSVELILHEDPHDEEDEINGPGHGKHYVLRDLKTGTETQFGKIPGFYGTFEILHDREDPNRHFLFEGQLRLAFFDLHLNSTDGDTVFALDFNGPRFVRLSPNWATPIPLPGETAFLTLTENRYVPIPGGKKTANCSYVEHWDQKLNKVRYAREKSAAVCYGMSMYRPGLTPPVITLRGSSE